MSNPGGPGHMGKKIKLAIFGSGGIFVAVIAGLITNYITDRYIQSHRPEETSRHQEVPDPQAPATPSAIPGPDFDSGSRPAVTAQLASWPTNATSDGTAKPYGAQYVVEPLSNTWIGPGALLDFGPLEGDFVVEIGFAVESRQSDAAVEVSLSGDDNYVEVFVEVWGTSGPTYSIEKGTIGNTNNWMNGETVASREPLPSALRDANWSETSRITVRREKGLVHLFVNGIFVRSFSLPVFTVKKIGLGAAFPSRVVIYGVQARTPV